MDNVIPVVFGMAFVTYLPRLIPLLLMKDKNIPKRVNAFLECIPVAAIGALIIPAIFTATPEKPIAGLIGISFTLVYGFWKGGIVIPVLGSVAVTYLVFMV